jgi:DNA-binding NarL/FixJ family response regulator
MRVLCIGRHPYLSEHLCRFFQRLGVETIPCVGITEAAESVRIDNPDAVICDYDLLTPMSLSAWEQDPALAQVPIIAVSLTRNPGDTHLLDGNGIAGFLYLPTLDLDDAHRVLAAARRNGGVEAPSVLSWPGSRQAAQLH